MNTTRRRLRSVGLLAVLVLSSLMWQLPGAPNADATLSNLFPADVDGFPKGLFRADEALFVTLTSDFSGGAVCIVDATVTDPSTVDCSNPRWGDTNQYVAFGTLLGVPLEQPLLRPGTWRLLSTDTSGKIGHELSEPFEVVSCTPTCDTTVATAQLQPWKDRAATQVPTAAQETRALAIDIATRTHKIMKAAYTGLSFGLGPALLAGGWAALNFDFIVPSTEDLAKALHKQLSATVREMYKGIAADPPDPNYGTVAPPVFEALDLTGDPLLDEYFDAMMRSAAYGTASRIANERYQGAVAGGDHAAAAMQAEASADFTYELIGQLRRLEVLAPQVSALPWANEPIVVAPDGLDPVVWWADQVAALSTLQPSDLSAADRQLLLDHGIGITDADIDAAVARWSDPTWVAEMQAVDPTQTIAEAIDSSTAQLGDTMTTLDRFGRWMSLNAADERALVPVNHPPVADPQAITGFEDEASTITLTGSDPDGDPITFAVTVGPTHGTLTGTPPNLTYTPAVGFGGTDSLSFTTSDGTLTSAPVTVTIDVAPNRPPTAPDSTVRVVPGLPKPLTLPGVDPDGRPITFTITEQPVHGTLTGDAPNLTYTADDSFTDGDHLIYSVSDGVHTSAPATVSLVPEPTAANDDALTVQGAQIIDVTANDVPVGAAVVDVTSPAHGTVTCSDHGLCLYVAGEGYEGPDSFDYTLVVGANESTATVAVTVEAPAVVAIGKPSATDDVLSTPSGTPGTVDVLANDTGDGTLVAMPSDGEHGTVSCDAAGTCTYTPTDSGFAGFDVFSYTLSNGTDVDTGLVRVRVGDPAGGLLVRSDSPSTSPGGSPTWVIRLLEGGPVAIGPAWTDPITVTASGPHGTLADSARTAEGWDLSVDGDQLTVTPGDGALLGDQATSVLPRPLPPISQGTGGDGHVPILVGTEVFAFFHHQSPTQITCVDRATGQLCPGYPRPIPVGTRNTPGPGAVVGTQIWAHVYARSYGISGLYCWDTATDQTCGMVANRPGAEPWNGTAPLRIGDELWFATGVGRLRCVDPATGAPCDGPPIDTGITFGEDYGDIVHHGTKVYVSNFTDATCVDVATSDRCPGWPEGGRRLPGNLVRSHDGTTGAVDGVCAVRSVMLCVRDDDPAAVVTTDVRWAATDTRYSASVEAEAGTRTLWGSNYAAGLGCFDWSTMALCTSPAFDVNGFSQYDIGRRALPRAYGAVWDGSCAVALGDPGQLFTMDADGSSPCTSLDSGASPLKVDLRRQRFDQSVGDATWNQVRVFDTDLGAGTNFTSFLVEVRDGGTGEVLASQEMVDTDGVLDLSGIDPVAHPSLTVGAVSRSVDGGEAWADGHAPKVQLRWSADAAPLGFQTRAVACVDGEVEPLVVRSQSGDLSDRREVVLDSPPPCTPPTTPTTTATTAAPTTTAPSGETRSDEAPSQAAVAVAAQPDAQEGPGGLSAGTPADASAGTTQVQATTLPRTGTDAWRLLRFGGLAILFGAVLVVATRRRRG